jgi:hypothetical protein
MKAKILPKDKRAMLLAPNPKSCSQYKRKEEKKSNNFFEKLPKDKGGMLLALNSNTCRIDEKI